MKKVVFLAVIGFCFLVFPISVFASGKCEVTLVNKTGATIDQVLVKESGKAAETPFYIGIDKDSSGEIILKTGITYDIALVDNKGHMYGKKRCKLLHNSAKIEIKKTDFMPQGFWDVVSKILDL